MIGFQPYETFQLLVETGGVDRANTLLIAACDAFAHRRKPPQSEVEQFEALASRLFRTAAPDARKKAARALAGSDSLSIQLQKLVVEHLGDSLAEFLIKAPVVDDGVLTEVISQSNIEMCAAIAARPDLNAAVLTRLFQMNSRKVYRALAANMSVVPRGALLSAFARSAQMDHEIARLLANRDDFDTALLAPAFFDLPESERLLVIHAFESRKTPDAPIKKTIEQIFRGDKGTDQGADETVHREQAPRSHPPDRPDHRPGRSPLRADCPRHLRRRAVRGAARLFVHRL